MALVANALFDWSYVRYAFDKSFQITAWKRNPKSALDEFLSTAISSHCLSVVKDYPYCNIFFFLFRSHDRRFQILNSIHRNFGCCWNGSFSGRLTFHVALPVVVSVHLDPKTFIQCPYISIN